MGDLLGSPCVASLFPLFFFFTRAGPAPLSFPRSSYPVPAIFSAGTPETRRSRCLRVNSFHLGTTPNEKETAARPG